MTHEEAVQALRNGAYYTCPDCEDDFHADYCSRCYGTRRIVRSDFNEAAAQLGLYDVVVRPPSDEWIIEQQKAWRARRQWGQLPPHHDETVELVDREVVINEQGEVSHSKFQLVEKITSGPGNIEVEGINEKGEPVREVYTKAIPANPGVNCKHKRKKATDDQPSFWYCRDCGLVVAPPQTEG